MNLLNAFSLENRPLVKYTIITLLAVNTIVLGLLLFKPDSLSFSSGRGSGGSGAASAGLTSDRETSDAAYSGTAYAADEDEDGSDGSTAFSTDQHAEEDAEPVMPPTGPLLVLTDDHVTLKVGEEFNFYEYIDTMVDRDGSSLSRYIHLTGSVDVNQPGDYLITYRITSQIDGESATADLLVTVEE